jgi:fibro-slime domain-containing protein
MKPQYGGLNGEFSKKDESEFSQWYRDVPGVNKSSKLSITLEDSDGDGVYRYENGEFFPVDGKLLGNEGREHNFHFTYEIHSKFTYRGGETFKFTGDDDLFVYINGDLVIDLGGVHVPESKEIKLDDLKLTPNRSYTLDFFFAERHTIWSNFKIETTIGLESAPPKVTPTLAPPTNEGQGY